MKKIIRQVKHSGKGKRAMFAMFAVLSATALYLWMTRTSALRIPMIPVSDSGDFDRASRAGYFLL